MHLRNLELHNFRLVEHLRLKMGERLTLLAGPNGAGKTTDLVAVAIGLGAVLTRLPGAAGRNFRKTGDLRQQGNGVLAPYTRVTLATTEGITWDLTQKRDTAGSTQKEIPGARGIKQLETFLDDQIIAPMNRKDPFTLPLFAYYGVHRALLELPQRRKGFPAGHERIMALAGALNASSSFKSAFIWFFNKENEEIRLQKKLRNFDVSLSDLDAVRRAISRMFPDISEPHIQHLDDPLQSPAVVMIDEVDLHLHPAWQRTVITDLLRTFPNTQFLVSTHSPFIIEAIKNSLERHKIADIPIDDPEISHIFPYRPKRSRHTQWPTAPLNRCSTGILDCWTIIFWSI